MQSIAILGRQPEFGLAELESLLGPENIQPLHNGIAGILFNNQLPYDRFGSVIKFAHVQAALLPSQPDQLSHIIAAVVEQLHPYESGVKLKVGISDYSNSFSVRTINAIGLSVKKILKKNDYSVRVIPNKTAKLSSAHIIHNKLTSAHGIECIIFKNGGALHLAVTVHEQDIEGYAARDQARPMRDARVGMLPPKLAQTIINLATGHGGVSGIVTGIQKNPVSPVSSIHSPTPTILDPFCGTGVILQEALLMGYNTYGTDLEPRMIDYSNQNIAWLRLHAKPVGTIVTEIGDATTHHWQQPVDYIAAETYLGKPLTRIPQQHELMDIVQSVNTLHKKVLANIHGQITPSTRICLAVPAWRTPKGFMHLPVLDQLDKLGYNQLVFSHTNARNLIYARADQIVARQLVVLQKQ